MRIAFVNNEYQLGGAETVVRQLHNGCRDSGHESSLYLADGRTYPLRKGIKPLYPKVLSWLYQSRLHELIKGIFPRYECTDRNLSKLGRSNHDLIHVHNFHGIYASMETLAQLSKQKKVVWTMHGTWAITGGCDSMLVGCRRFLDNCGHCPQLGFWPIGLQDNTAQEFARKKAILGPAPLTIVTPSAWLHKEVVESPIGKHWDVHRIPNGVDINHYSPDNKRDTALRESLNIDPTSIVILAVTRDFKDSAKGGSMSSEALQSLKSGNVTVLLAGRNSLWLKDTLDPSLKVQALEYVSSPEMLAKLYKVSDIFLMGSVWENFPCVVLEAMASGCCVVSTPASGIDEQIVDGASGVIAAEKSGQSLSKALGSIMANPSNIAVFGQNARERAVSLFSEDLMVKRYIALYSDLLEGKS